MQKDVTEEFSRRRFGEMVAQIFVCLETFKLVSPDVEFFIRNDDEQINVLVMGRGNLSEDQKIEITRNIAAKVEDHPAIESIYIKFWVLGDRVDKLLFSW